MLKDIYRHNSIRQFKIDKEIIIPDAEIAISDFIRYLQS